MLDYSTQTNICFISASINLPSIPCTLLPHSPIQEPQAIARPRAPEQPKPSPSGSLSGPGKPQGVLKYTNPRRLSKPAFLDLLRPIHNADPKARYRTLRRAEPGTQSSKLSGWPLVLFFTTAATLQEHSAPQHLIPAGAPERPDADVSGSAPAALPASAFRPLQLHHLSCSVALSLHDRLIPTGPSPALRPPSAATMTPLCEARHLRIRATRY
ncbi:hypothetical protein VTO73DRAFT_13531 [Trametes versicolor]